MKVRVELTSWGWMAFKVEGDKEVQYIASHAATAAPDFLKLEQRRELKAKGSVTVELEEG